MPPGKAAVLAADIDAHLARTVVKVVALVHQEIVRRAPVDTGWSRANWIPGLTPAPRDPAVDLTDRPDSARITAASARSGAGLASVLSGYKSIKQGAVWIVNHVPYVPALNQNHKTAKRFIEDGIDAAIVRAGVEATVSKGAPKL